MQKNLPASFFYYKFIEVNITVQIIMTIRVIKPDIATGEYLETGNIMMINNFAKDEGSEFNV